jgi:hypothetical protein
MVRDFYAAVKAATGTQGWSLLVTDDPRSGAQQFTLQHVDGRSTSHTLTRRDLLMDADAAQHEVLLWVELTTRREPQFTVVRAGDGTTFAPLTGRTRRIDLD